MNIILVIITYFILLVKKKIKNAALRNDVFGVSMYKISYFFNRFLSLSAASLVSSGLPNDEKRK